METLTVEDGYVLQEEDYPAVPEKTGYSGTWTPYTLPVTADITIQASYAPAQHTVTFVAQGVTVDTIEVAHGYVLKDSDYLAVPEKSGFYGFWVEYTDPVESDITIQADYQMIQQHTVEFVTSGVLYGQTRVVKSMKVPTGYVLQESDYPEVPPKLGQLGRWKRYTDPIVQDITIHAEYGNPIPGTPTNPPSLMSTGDEPYSSGYTAQPISTVTEEHSYIYASGMLLREGSTTKTLDFRYDNVGYPYALIYNNGSTTATYYYITNLQGDVMYLVDSNGNQVAAYTYDPYGKILSAYGSMAEINPLRYRGYYYDSETGFYYLQSRYYDPNTCRFINADGYASTGQGLMGYNMFAYCNNNSVNSADPAGYAAWGTNMVSICDGGTSRHVTAIAEDEKSKELYDFLYMVHEVPRRDEGSCETYVSVILNNERVEYKNNNIRQIIDSGLTAFGVVDYFLGFTNPYIAAILTFGSIVIEALPDQLRPADGKYDAYTVNTVRVYTSPEVGGYYIKTRITSSIYLWVDY